MEASVTKYIIETVVWMHLFLLSSWINNHWIKSSSLVICNALSESIYNINYLHSYKLPVNAYKTPLNIFSWTHALIQLQMSFIRMISTIPSGSEVELLIHWWNCHEISSWNMNQYWIFSYHSHQYFYFCIECPRKLMRSLLPTSMNSHSMEI